MMSVRERFSSTFAEGRGNLVRDAWKRLSPLPGGKVVFTRMIGMAAPYTGTIPTHVEELRSGYARVRMEDRRHVRNHLRCVHAIALANLCEVTGNLALAYTLPDDARFIVAGMSVDYLKKARGPITGICELEPIRSSERREHPVEVTLFDKTGDEVVRGVLRSLVGPKRSAD